MSATTFRYPHEIRVRRGLAIGLIATLILMSLTLIAGAILSRSSSTSRDSYQADRIPVVRNSILPISIPNSPTGDIRLVESETPILTPVVASEPSVLSIPVPTPPS